MPRPHDVPRPPHLPSVMPGAEAGSGGAPPGTTSRMPPPIEALIAAAGPGYRQPAAIRQRVEMMERLLEGAFTIPGTQKKAGLDAVIGLIPGIGDAISAALGAYLLWEARNLGMSKWQLWRMAGNLGVDTAIGAVPLVGDLFDLVYRSNSRNLRIIRAHLDRHHPDTVTIDAAQGARPDFWI